MMPAHADQLVGCVCQYVCYSRLCLCPDLPDCTLQASTLHHGRSAPLLAWHKAQANVWLAPTWAAGLLGGVLACGASVKQVS
jgi:hypothetical protein